MIFCQNTLSLIGGYLPMPANTPLLKKNHLIKALYLKDDRKKIPYRPR